MPKLRLYNSLTRKKEEFTPLDPSHVRVYACGPTVYNYAHIGNARMAVVFDLLANVLRSIYPKVTYVSNITDVDDKIMVAAKESGEAIDVITRKFEKIYNEDMAALGVAKPDVQPRATEHIPEMIALCEALIKRGHAYEAEGNVLFNVPSFAAYGGLSGRSRDEQIAGARVDVAPYKKDPADFVLWKPSAADQPGWDSPWGFGRPGWHIECSAMAEKHLGLPFDIHGGGADLKFPHHENEIAQSCCAHGKDDDLSAFAKMWVHNGFVTVGGEKMSKSLGNFLLVHDLIEEFPGEALRLTLLSAHYRQPLDLTKEKIAESKRILDRLYRTLYDLRDVQISKSPAVADIEFQEALLDDLNTPQAIAVLNQISSASANDAEEKKTLLAAGGMLGLLQQNPAKWLGYDVSGDNDVEKLLAERTEAKAAKNFKRADEIRDEVKALGFTIEDTPEGPKARKI
ncbi:MAG TPA: cysteine--tRNA ligase [Alphaproteobacteria bacterium]|nr:cysteine--tRNA ligase [Micavibrio sp.]HQX26449.1 cysteine--tRNA ligase [Alphaproteobacteria bacterium]